MNTQAAPFVPKPGANATLAWVRDHLSNGLRAVFEARCKASGAPTERTIVERRGRFLVQLMWGRAGLQLPLRAQRPEGFSRRAR